MNGSRRRRQTDTSRILVGYWRESTEPEPNQHAVFGILSRDGKLRFKVVAETREGDHINGPLNPGDSWIVYDEVGPPTIPTGHPNHHICPSHETLWHEPCVVGDYAGRQCKSDAPAQQGKP